MATVYISRKFPEQGIKILKDAGHNIVLGSGNGSFAKNAKGADAVIPFLTDSVDGACMDAIGSQLKIIANYAVGFDNIDVAAAAKRGIAVTNTPGVLTDAVAEYAVALALAVARSIPQADAFVRSGKYKQWDPNLFVGMELRGKVFGLVGHGRIGCSTADKMKTAFSMKVVYYDAFRDPAAEERCGISYAPLHDMLVQADIVSIHVPLTDSTRHLIGEKELRSMKQGAFLVNTARGAVIDENALVEALKSGHLGGAALDVFEQEPKLTSGLAKLKNVVLTPHIASATKDARDRMAETATANVAAVLSGKNPLNPVA